MRKIVTLLLVLMLTGGFAYTQDSDSEETSGCSDERDIRSVMLCLPSYYFPERGSVFTPHFTEEKREIITIDGMRYAQHFQGQEPEEQVGPLNPLTLELHIQGINQVMLDAPIIYFAPAAAFEGQLNAVNGAMMTAVGPLHFGADAYAIVPRDQADTAESTGFEGTLVFYDPRETTARETLHEWLLYNRGWYIDVEDPQDELEIVDDGGACSVYYDVDSTNALWAEEYRVFVEAREESIFTQIEALVQCVFWRFYKLRRPVSDANALWLELVELLNGLMGEDSWNDQTRTYLNNYRELLGVWIQAYADPRFDLGLYVPPSIPVHRAHDRINELIEVAEDPLLWPTGRVRVLEGNIPVRQRIRLEPVGGGLVFEGIDSPLRVPTQTALGAAECWF